MDRTTMDPSIDTTRGVNRFCVETRGEEEDVYSSCML